MLSRAKSANVRFQPVVQLFAPATNSAMHLTQKIPFINQQKAFVAVSGKTRSALSL